MKKFTKSLIYGFEVSLIKIGGSFINKFFHLNFLSLNSEVFDDKSLFSIDYYKGVLTIQLLYMELYKHWKKINKNDNWYGGKGSGRP